MLAVGCVLLHGRSSDRHTSVHAAIVPFWSRGRLTKGYTLRDLGYRRDALQRTASHYAWGSYEGFDTRGYFRLTMIDGVSLVFDPASGELLERVAPDRPGGAPSR